MEQNLQVLDEHCQHGITIKHVRENVKHRASEATGMSKMSLDGEPHAETTVLSQSFEHGKNDSRHFHYRREAYKQNKETDNAARPCGQKSSWLSTCLLKAGLAQICSQVRKHEKHTFESEI